MATRPVIRTASRVPTTPARTSVVQPKGMPMLRAPARPAAPARPTIPARPAAPLRPTAAAAQAAMRPTTRPLVTSTVRPAAPVARPSIPARPTTSIARPTTPARPTPLPRPTVQPKPQVTTRPTVTARPTTRPATSPTVTSRPTTSVVTRPTTGTTRPTTPSVGPSVGPSGSSPFTVGPGSGGGFIPITPPRDANGNIAWKQAADGSGAYFINPNDGKVIRPGAANMGFAIDDKASAASVTGTKAPSATSTLKPSVTTKPTVTTPKPTTIAPKPTVTTPTTKPVTSTVVNPARPSSSATNTILGAALGVGANALMSNIGKNVAGKIVAPTTNQPKVTPPKPATSVVRPPAGTKPPVAKPPVAKAPAVAPKAPAGAATTPTSSTTGQEDLPGNVRVNEDGTFTQTMEDGSTLTYDASGNVIASTPAPDETTVTTGEGEDAVTAGEGQDQTTQYYEDGAGNIYASDGSMVYNAATGEYLTSTGGTDAQDQTDGGSGQDQYWTDGAGNWYDNDGNLVYSENDQFAFTEEDQQVAQDEEQQEEEQVASSDSGDEEYEAKNGGFIDLLYKKGGALKKAAGGIVENEDGTYYIDNGDGTFDLYSSDDEYMETLGTARTEMSDGSFMEDNGDGTMSYYDADGNWLYTTDSSGNLTAAGNPNDGTTVIYNPDGSTSTIDANGNVVATGGTMPGGTVRPNLVAGQPNQNNTGVLNALKGALGDGGVGAAAIGALLGNMMSQGDSPTTVNEGVDMAQLAQLQQGYGSGISVGGGQPGGSYYVPYEQYAYWNQPPEDQLYADLGVSGFAPQPEGYYAEGRGRRYDYQPEYQPEYQQPVDETGYGMPTEQMPDGSTATFAGGGSTHFTYGTAVRPEDNLGMKRGGLSQAHTMHSHHTNPIVQGRIDFRQGSAVNGAGDGQSDDIPAMLADGEYVIDAETVAQIGNGSNKAGAKALDKFREEIRKHKRSAPLDKIPPKTKALTSYLKGQ